MYEFPCPHCSAKLRLRDRSLRGRTVDCPDCHAPVRIEESPDGLQGVPATRAATAPVEQPVTLAGSALAAPIDQRRTIRIIWGACGLLLVTLLLWTTWPASKAELDTSPPVQPAPIAEGPAAPPAPESPPPVAADPLPVQRFKGISEQLARHVQQHAAWPNGQSPTGLSWLGTLEQTNPAAPGYRADQPWNDVANDPFVRRKLVEYQLPDVPQLVGEDGYPAGHFAGVTGIGPDAAELPASHPRAGIFGTNRTTRPEDVTDGRANTMLVVGVNKQLGSWAAPGAATLRSFTAEPYINGPDGIGTGQADSMYVLMADGSVRLLSADTDPVIIRRMAAMADGLPLDMQVTGDPGMMPNPAGPKPAPAGPMDRPIMVEIAPEPPPFNVQRSLQQKIVRFEQTRPLPLRKLLFQWAELAAIPVDISRVPAATLDQEFEFLLEDITLRELLDQFTSAAKLTAETSDEFGVRLIPVE